MTTIEALFDLYEALGGDVDSISTLETIPELLEEISEIAGSTIELPGVTASDNGDVLTVVGGKWAKAAASTPALTIKSFTKAGLQGTIQTYGNVSTIAICTYSGTITSKSESLGVGFNVPTNLLYVMGRAIIPLYQNAVQVGYCAINSTTISVTVDESVTATSASPVYGNLTTL